MAADLNPFRITTAGTRSPRRLFLLTCGVVGLWFLFCISPSPYYPTTSGFVPHSKLPESQGSLAWKPPKFSSLKYSTVVGFFKQSLPDTDEDDFDFISSNFGLLDDFQVDGSILNIEDAEESEVAVTPKWREFEKAIKKLNENAPDDIRYRVLFLGRHGQGHHNVAESFYGTHLWDCYWSLLDGNGTSRWDDSQLTEVGIHEAELANGAWKQQIKYGVPLPEIWYSSPFTRAASTLEITWRDITLNNDKYPKPIIKEKFRETMGIHTCDRRSSKCEIARIFPQFTFEPGFQEGPDPFWDPVNREPDDEKVIRLKAGLDEIFTADMQSTFISITAHSGAIAALLEAVGHREFKLQTGGMIPVVVKVQYVQEQEPPTSVGPSRVAPRCTVDPTPAPLAN